MRPATLAALALLCTLAAVPSSAEEPETTGENKVFIVEVNVVELARTSIAPIYDTVKPSPTGKPRQVIAKNCSDERISIYDFRSRSLQETMRFIRGLIDALAIDLKLTDTTFELTCTRERAGHIGWMPGNPALPDSGVSIIHENHKTDTPGMGIRLVSRPKDFSGIVVFSFGSFEPFEKLWADNGLIPKQALDMRAAQSLINDAR